MQTNCVPDLSIYSIVFNAFLQRLGSKEKNLEYICNFLSAVLLQTSLCIHWLTFAHSGIQQGVVVPDSTVLLYDPTIRFFHSEHIPYAILAFVTLVIVLLCPLFLVLYPVKSFRRCLHFIGFRRWDIVYKIMDIFQGWYKDGYTRL